MVSLNQDHDSRYSETYYKLRDAFEELRESHDLYTRLGIGCCRSCIGAELGAQLAHAHSEHDFNDDECVDGWAFFSNQTDKSGDYFSIAYNKGVYYNGGDDPQTTTDLETEDIGQLVAEVCEQHDLDVYWSGDTGETILVGEPPERVIERRESRHDY